MEQQVYLALLHNPVYNKNMEVITTTVKKLLYEYKNVMGLKDIKIPTDFEFKFGEYNFELPEQKRERVLSMWNSGLITLSEARKELELEDIEGVDLFRWELESPGNLSGGQQQEKLTKNNEK